MLAGTVLSFRGIPLPVVVLASRAGSPGLRPPGAMEFERAPKLRRRIRLHALPASELLLEKKCSLLAAESIAREAAGRLPKLAWVCATGRVTSHHAGVVQHAFTYRHRTPHAPAGKLLRGDISEWRRACAHRSSRVPGSSRSAGPPGRMKPGAMHPVKAHRGKARGPLQTRGGKCLADPAPAIQSSQNPNRSLPQSPGRQIRRTRHKQAPTWARRP